MAITAEERSQIISLVVGMFGAAPGAAVLSELTNIVDDGTSIATLADWLAGSAEFNDLYPNFLTNEEFAVNYTENLLGDTLAAEDEQWVVDYITAELNAGRSRASIIVEAITALATIEEDHELFGAAVAQFNNQVEVATYYSVTAQRSGDSVEALQDVIAGVTNDDATVDSALENIDNGSNPGQTFTFTTGVDTVVGGNGDDVFNAGSDDNDNSTLTSLDSINGGNGTDTLYIIDVNDIDIDTTVTVTGVEVVSAVSAEEFNGDVSDWTGLETLTVVANGYTADQDITAGAADVTLTNSVSDSADVTGGTITVNGGGSVTITNNLSQSDLGSTTTGGDITVNGGAATTDVTVTQTAPVTPVATVTAVTESASVVMDAAGLANTQTYTIGGLTLTASGAIAAADVAAGFASLAAGATTGNVVANGTWSGTLTGYSTGAAAGTTVVFTSTTAGNVADLTPAAVGATAAVATITQGVAAVAGSKGIVVGDVTITDTNSSSTSSAGVITSVDLTNFANATVNSGALTDVTLTGKGTTFNAGTLGALTTATATAAVDLNVEGFTSTGAVTFDNDVKTLNVNGSVGNSTIANLSTGATALNVSGDKTVTLTAATLGTNAVVTSTNSSGLVISSTLATTTTFTGGDGKDAVTLGAATKAITMGAGDDTVTLTGSALGTGGSVDAGEGTDTLSMTGANADAVTTLEDKISGFERLTITTPASATVDLEDLDDIDYVSTAGATALVLDNIASEGTLVLTGASTLVTVNVADADDGASDEFNVKVSSSTASNAGTVTIADVETINLNTDATGTSTIQQTLVLNADSATTLNVSGDAGVILTLTGSADLETIDTSGVTKGAVSVTTAADVETTFTGGATDTTINIDATTEDSSITTGAGDDTITGGDGDDTIVAGDGDNSITGGLGGDTMTGGADDDTFVYGAAADSQGVTTDTITNFGEDDILDFSAISEGTAVYVGEASGYGAVLTSLSGGDVNTQAVLDTSTNTLYVDVDGSGTLDTNDIAINLTGVTDLTNADNFVW